jgi:protein-disulfide isomerase
LKRRWNLTMYTEAKKHDQPLQMEKTKKTKLMILTILTLLAVLIIGINIFNRSHKETVKIVDTNVFQFEKQPFLGSKNAPVKIVEFADFKCPACKKFDQSILPQLQKDFIDKGTAQLFFINYPIISPLTDSKTAAMAGEAIYAQNPEEFWKFYKIVYDNQGDEQTVWASSNFLVNLAKKSNLKVDYEKLKTEIDQNKYTNNLNEDLEIVDRLGINSTPTIFINGKEIPKSETFDYSKLKEEILNSKGENFK